MFPPAQKAGEARESVTGGNIARQMVFGNSVIDGMRAADAAVRMPNGDQRFSMADY
jgi:hypothetical protein